MLIALRNFAIIALLALLVTIAPGGGNAIEALLTALSLIFLAAIGLLLVRFWDRTSFARDAMTDRQRWTIYGAIGAIALMIAGLDELLNTGAGTILWLAVMAGSGFLIWQTWREANSL